MNKFPLTCVIFILILTLMSKIVMAKQSDFFEDGKIWENERYFPFGVNEDNSPNIIRTKIQVVGDTLLCGKSAKILRTTFLDPSGVELKDEPYPIQDFVYDENGVIYFYAEGYGKFFELLNFNVQLRDSLYTNYGSFTPNTKNFSLQVIEDSRINIFGIDRHVLKLENNSRRPNKITYWIEGIGSTNGTFIPMFPATTNGDRSYLTKCYKGNTVYFSREELGKILPEAALPNNFFQFLKENYLVYPIGLYDLDSYSYLFLTDPLDPNAELREVAFCGCPHFVNCQDRNWGTDFVVPDMIVFQGREYSVTQIDKIATDKIRNLTIPPTVRRLSDFSISTSELETLSLPASLQSIGYTICHDSHKLKSVEIAAVIPPVLSKDEELIGDSANDCRQSQDYQVPFTEINENCTLIVPEGSGELYRQDPVFGRFPKIVEKKFGQSSVGSTEANGVSVTAIAGGLEISCSQPTKAWIYSIDGAPVKSLSIDFGTSIVNLPQGLYIVKTEFGTIKQMIK